MSLYYKQTFILDLVTTKNTIIKHIEKLRLDTKEYVRFIL